MTTHPATCRNGHTNCSSSDPCLACSYDNEARAATNPNRAAEFHTRARLSQNDYERQNGLWPKGQRR